MNSRLVLRSTISAIAVAAALTAAGGCAPAHPAAVTPPVGTGSSGGGAAQTAQVDRGKKIYAGYCSGCHGEKGEGGSAAPALSGARALSLEPPPGARTRKTAFRTAGDVFDYVKANMPPSRPGSLGDDQYYALVAYQLAQNGVAVTGPAVDAGTAGGVALR